MREASSEREERAFSEEGYAAENKTWLGYSQKDGFVELEASLPDTGDGDLETWLFHLGFYPWGSEGSPDHHELEVYHHCLGIEPVTGCRYFAWIGGHWSCDGVFVKTRADLVALKLLVAPFLLLDVIDEMRDRAERKERKRGAR